jgi:expansin (peptidoglycan-binding protein)
MEIPGNNLYRVFEGSSVWFGLVAKTYQRWAMHAVQHGYGSFILGRGA